jgi:tRNA threonylcarbamoyl adenosine modification protein (Sua5/YciO/YrdC/YwlC family)
MSLRGVSDGDIAAAARALASGDLICLPTDTVYGIAADAFLADAVERIFTAKQRPPDMELPVLVADVDQALEVASTIPDMALPLIEAFWPGALTIVLPAIDGVTVGVRCPDHAVPLGICEALGPIATTSANRHGQPTPATAAEVAEVFGDAVALVLDGGPCTGSPSTVIDCTGPRPRLLREGRIPWSELEAFIRAG